MKPPDPDPAFEVSLRPPMFSEFTGQVKVCERLELLEYDTEGLGVADVDLAEVVKLTAPGGGRPGFTFSDLRTRLVPDAVLRAYPDRGLTVADLVAAAAELEPSPSVEVEG